MLKKPHKQAIYLPKRLDWLPNIANITTKRAIKRNMQRYPWISFLMCSFLAAFSSSVRTFYAIKKRLLKINVLLIIYYISFKKASILFMPNPFDKRAAII